MPVFDFLVIGTGAAGLSCALELAELGEVAVLGKGGLSESASDWAQGGIAAVTGDIPDSIEAHVADTLDAGAGLCHRDRVQQILGAAPAAIGRLIQWGVPFDREDGRWHLTREGGHSARRVLHQADHTGQAITRTLLRQASLHSRIHLFGQAFAGDLILREGSCQGVWALDTDGQWEAWVARAVILASGGLGQLYLHTSNPRGATGDGMALAYRAGAQLAGLEFVQFHPTTLYDPGQPAFLLSEALRGEGAILRLPGGGRFVERYDPRAELAPRDIVTRAIQREMMAKGLSHVELDISGQPAEKIRSHFPGIYAHCLARGYDLTRSPVPVVPAAHYSCGGIVTDMNGETTIPSLYAVGEVAWTGLHGANRLASNSLLECIVMAHFTARNIARKLAGRSRMPRPRPRRQDIPRCSQVPDTWTVTETRHRLQAGMWEDVGILRSPSGMASALGRWEQWLKALFPEPCSLLPDQEASELRNLLQTAILVTAGALHRQESRGCHYDTAFPHPRTEPLDLFQSRQWPEPQSRAVLALA